MERIIGVYDVSAGYSENLASYINSRKDVGYRSVALRETSEIYRLLEKGSLSILLSDNPEHQMMFGGSISVFISSEDPSECDELAPDNVNVFKYRKAPEILKLITGKEDSPQTPSEVSLVTVFCPGSNACGNNVAKKTAKGLAEKKKTLFIPWDCFTRMGAESGNVKGTSISELLFAIRQNRSAIPAILSGLPKEEGYEYLTRTQFYSDLWQFSAEEMSELVSICREQGRFENIVFAIGFMSDAVERLMRESDEVLIVSEEGDFAENGYCVEFMRQMKYGGRIEILHKIREMTA